MDRIIKHNRIITSIFAVLVAFSSVILSVSNTYAIDFSTDVEFVDGVSQPRIYPLNYVCTASVCNGFANAWTSFLTSTQGGIKDYLHEIPNRQYQYGDIIMLGYNLTVSANTVANHSSFAGLRYTGTNPVNVLYTDVSQLNDTGGTVYVYLWVYNTFTDSNLKLEALDGGFSWYLQAGNGGTGQSLKLLNVQVLRQKNTSSPDYSSALGTIQNGINSVNNNLNTINNGIQDVQDSVDDLSQTQQDIYDDEKDTINQNGDDASDLWNGTTFSLNFTDPFTTIWNLFTDSKCVDITTLANLVNAPQISTVCSPYPDGVKEIFSPCFNLFAVFFAVFFFIRWLSDSSGVVVNTFETVYTPTSIKTRRK